MSVRAIIAERQAESGKVEEVEKWKSGKVKVQSGEVKSTEVKR
jgi:hypothetical protein